MANIAKAMAEEVGVLKKELAIKYSIKTDILKQIEENRRIIGGHSSRNPVDILIKNTELLRKLSEIMK